MNEEAGPYAGLDRFECRARMLADSARAGLLVKVERSPHSVGHCQRCDTIVEPLLSQQWFVKMKPLAEPAIEAVRERPHHVRARALGEDLLRLDGKHPRLVHLAPALVGPSHPRLVLRRRATTRWSRARIRKPCGKCGAPRSTQDPDVLDTWFSLRAVAVLHARLAGRTTEDLRVTIPTTVLVTGYDIIFFWVARMIMIGLEFMGDVPFRDGLSSTAWCATSTGRR